VPQQLKAKTFPQQKTYRENKNLPIKELPVFPKNKIKI
jgi:hypothetical protein